MSGIYSWRPTSAWPVEYQRINACLCCSMSPITVPEGWEFAIPEGSREFTIRIIYGRVSRPALILKNADGKYDRVAIYKDKASAEPRSINVRYLQLEANFRLASGIPAY